MKRIFALLLSVTMLLSVCSLTACGGKKGGSGEKGGDEDTVKVSFWIGKGENSSFYPSYDDNPGIKYLESLEYNGKKIDLTFQVPIVGAELDNFNTLLMTDEYCGIMDMAYSTTNEAELYQDGYIYDLTDYVDQYMPNYKAVLDRYPHLQDLVYTVVDGEKRILSLYAITEDILAGFMGTLYRRDWLAKYGTDPETGEAFTWGYEDPSDFNTWYDDVVFPSWYNDELREFYLTLDPAWDGTVPAFISDWEWMFEIFTVALNDLGITDGYCLAPYYKGFQEDGGGGFNAFGGGGALWYRDKDGNAAFGGTSDSMRAYLQCMNSWWENGWLDPAFAEHTSDAAYGIDSTKVHTGKVGMFVGRRAETGGQMDIGDAYTKDIFVAGARPPINDLYGSDAEKFQVPYTLYQHSQLRGKVVISNAVSEEDLPTVLTFLDYLYTAEGGVVICLGLTQEQFEQTQDEIYLKYGLTRGTYYTEEQEDGSIKYIRHEELISDNDLASAMAAKRLYVGWYAPGFNDALNASYMSCATEAMAQWDFFINTGYPDKAFEAQFSVEESTTFDKVHANVEMFMSTQLPSFIMGKLDVDSEEDWAAYCKMVNKYSPEKVTKIYQSVYDKSTG